MFYACYRPVLTHNLENKYNRLPRICRQVTQPHTNPHNNLKLSQLANLVATQHK